MALTFATNSLQLANWGFSVTDVISLIGAGRGIITWLSADGRDSNLLSFLNIDETVLGLRPGLLDPSALNKRWGKEVLLLRNGEPTTCKAEGEDSEIENVRRFTWMMTLITACLDVAMTSQSVNMTICDFVARLFADKVQPGIEEYLQKEIPLHVQGWRSTATVRKIFPRARDIWDNLEKQDDHQAGFIPDQECEELARMLIWIVTKGEDTFRTNSSDLYSVAFILAELGFDLLRLAVEKVDYEGVGIITLIKTEHALLDEHVIRPSRDLRRGMRVPLSNMEDAVALWPENPERNNRRRMIFANGMSSARGVSFHACSSSSDSRSARLAIRVTSATSGHLRHVPTTVFALMDRYFLLPTHRLFLGLSKLIGSWNIGQEYLEALSELGEEINPGEKEGNIGEEFQIFLMGYYYNALGSVVDTSRLVYKEVFGSWGWGDPHFFRHILQLTRTRLKTETRENLYWRYRIISLVGYLFTGAEDEALSLVDNDTIGFVGKISVLTPGLFGDADTPEKLSKLILLDVDTSAIPKNGQGIIKTAKSHNVRPLFALNNIDSLDLGALTSCDPDFTSNIEPAWGYDVNLVLLAYRYKGRLVFKADPLETEVAIIRWWAPATPAPSHIASAKLNCESLRRWILEQHTQCGETSTVDSLEDFYCTTLMAIQSHSDYCNGLIYLGPSEMDPQASECLHEGNSHVVIIKTKGLSKARACILSMHNKVLDDEGASLSGFAWAQFFPGCLVGATSDRALVVIT
jgi:hypothetical protein